MNANDGKSNNENDTPLFNKSEQMRDEFHLSTREVHQIVYYLPVDQFIGSVCLLPAVSTIH